MKHIFFTKGKSVNKKILALKEKGDDVVIALVNNPLNPKQIDDTKKLYGESFKITKASKVMKVMNRLDPEDYKVISDMRESMGLFDKIDKMGFAQQEIEREEVDLTSEKVKELENQLKDLDTKHQDDLREQLEKNTIEYTQKVESVTKAYHDLKDSVKKTVYGN